MYTTLGLNLGLPNFTGFILYFVLYNWATLGLMLGLPVIKKEALDSEPGI